MSPIQKRLLRHFASGKSLSIKNMWMMCISNCSREVIRNFEVPFDVVLDRKVIPRTDEYSHANYTEYSVNKKDLRRIIKIAKKHGLYYIPPKTFKK